MKNEVTVVQLSNKYSTLFINIYYQLDFKEHYQSVSRKLSFRTACHDKLLCYISEFRYFLAQHTKSLLVRAITFLRQMT